MDADLDRQRMMRYLENNARIIDRPLDRNEAAQLNSSFQNTIGIQLARFKLGAYSTAFGGQHAVTFARKMWMGSRFAIDPVTGLPRLSQQTMQARPRPCMSTPGQPGASDRSRSVNVRMPP
jgi:hypothetical protein